MADTIRLEVVTPNKRVVNEDVQIVVAPGSLGDFGVLIGHTPFLTTLRTGAIQYRDVKGNEKVVFVSGGFAEALPDKVTILAESAEKIADIDIDRVKAAIERAKKRLSGDDSKIDHTRAKAALGRGMGRLHIVKSMHLS